MAHHWGLTEQLFKSVSILSKKDVFKTHQHILRFDFKLFKAPLPHQFGIEEIWIASQKVLVSNIHRTIIDMIENPACGGGIQATIDALKTYFKEAYDEQTFITYASSLKNGVFFKRLGFLTEKLFDTQHPLVKLSKERMTKGYSAIDTHLPCPKLITRWNLRVHEDLDL
jgi:predicted transcriptional regulator of viral defense system